MISRSRTAQRFSLDPLEARICLAAVFNYADFSTTPNLVFNGYGGGPTTNGPDQLVLTDGGIGDARSVWYATPVDITAFSTHFTYVSDPSPGSADGFTFTVQAASDSQLGLNGERLGYVGMDSHSVAMGFNLYNTGPGGSQFGTFVQSAASIDSVDMGPVNLHSGHTFDVTIVYDGTDFNVRFVDQSDPTTSFTASRTITLAAGINSTTALVGFTAATGSATSTQSIGSWDFSTGAGSSTPTIVTPATAAARVSGTGTTLRALGDDFLSPHETGLTYTWSVLAAPNGARAPLFSENAIHDAADTRVSYFKAGNYQFRCTIENGQGNSITTDVTLRVVQRAIGLRITPHARTLIRNARQTYSANVTDQFGHALRAQPTMSWSVTSGTGTIDESSGAFRAGHSGHEVIRADAGDLFGVVGTTVRP